MLPPRSRRPLKRVNLLRLGVTLVVLATIILSMVLPGGPLRVMLRGVIGVAALVILGSYLSEWWGRRRHRS